MKKNLWLVAGLALAVSSAFAADKAANESAAQKEIAATFAAEASGNTVSIFSNSKKARRCDVFVNFSVVQNGQRVPGISRCVETDIPAGKHVLVCDFTREAVVDPKIEGAVGGFCK